MSVLQNIYIIKKSSKIIKTGLLERMTTLGSLLVSLERFYALNNSR